MRANRMTRRVISGTNIDVLEGGRQQARAEARDWPSRSGRNFDTLCIGEVYGFCKDREKIVSAPAECVIAAYQAVLACVHCRQRPSWRRRLRDDCAPASIAGSACMKQKISQQIVVCKQLAEEEKTAAATAADADDRAAHLAMSLKWSRLAETYQDALHLLDEYDPDKAKAER
jgi:hypothetical protein